MMGSATFRRSPLGASPTTTARTRMCRRFGCLSEGRALAMPGRRDRAGLILRIDSWSMQLSFYFDDDCPVLRFALVGPPFLNLNFALVHQLRLLSWLSRGRAQPTRQSE